MKTFHLNKLIFIGICLLTTVASGQQETKTATRSNLIQNPQNKIMKTYLIEREIPNAGELTADQLQGISQKSNEVLSQMGPSIQWIHSYVTENKVYCVYKAENKEMIKKHAVKGGFPADKISELATTIDPNTAKD